jgi:hypothetical protein
MTRCSITFTARVFAARPHKATHIALYPGVMIQAAPSGDVPVEFSAALDSAELAVFRSELRVHETAAPEGLAPFQRAWAADVEPSSTTSDEEYGTGRLVFLCDPERPDAWGSPYRMVVFAQAPVDPSMGADQFLPNVAWSWLIDALETRGAQYINSAGTTTTVLSTGFGDLASEGQGAQVEVRASWSPTTSDIRPHLEAWSEFVCMLAGFPPTPDGVSALPPQRQNS